MWDKKILVEKLKQFRQDHDLTQKDMYTAMGCSQSAYSNYENESSPRLPSIENLINLSDKFEISIDELLGIPTYKNPKISDILSTLCDIFRQVPYRIEKVTVPVDINWDVIPDQDGCTTARLVDKERYAIYFDSDRYDGALKDMAAILSMRQNWDTMDKMLDLWQKDLKKQYPAPANDACLDD